LQAGKYLENLNVYWPPGGLPAWNYFIYLILSFNNNYVYHTQVSDSISVSLHQCNEMFKKPMTLNTEQLCCERNVRSHSDRHHNNYTWYLTVRAKSGRISGRRWIKLWCNLGQLSSMWGL